MPSSFLNNRVKSVVKFTSPPSINANSSNASFFKVNKAASSCSISEREVLKLFKHSVTASTVVQAVIVLFVSSNNAVKISKFKVYKLVSTKSSVAKASSLETLNAAISSVSTAFISNNALSKRTWRFSLVASTVKASFAVV